MGFMGSKLGRNVQDEIVLDREAASRLCFDRPPLGSVSVFIKPYWVSMGQLAPASPEEPANSLDDQSLRYSRIIAAIVLAVFNHLGYVLAQSAHI